ncbi:hypothetical protein PHMEG_00016563 [Phytophthora megakarya]|uniref:Uncharacterized protein n=1 Tax=Phytophthora megakarya TaxID=4795 RepID=A0A225W132_9STRA|nr:hypothetical protein PHMEG_00016563 [Phytophthora megakarya]
MKRDNNTPERVRLTLIRALAHLLEDSPHWWRAFNEAVRAVDYHSPNRQAALNGLALRLASSTPSTSTEP